ncbi:MAG: glycerol dehydrogenase [Candidatus Methanomethylophilus sp.]|nr:glycerol dehydrogenase [Methanomethylophilus sp.]MDD3233113.1 glycerol dehydrogenase [Methanomethylophilus sp.]MDD4221678.1 glycerol dehydrogenase [Methanomethylophilus sp.]MDD4668476.1 glycerol dehydrogenase [Methanomethylophilus sp.]
MNARETAWRLFSTELNSATFEIKATEEKKPSYQLSRLGAMINRVLIVGVLTEKENVGTPDEPLWRGRIQDVASGTVFINVGRYQPEAGAALAELEPPCLVAMVGKVKSYTTEDQRTFVSVRPEHIVTVDEQVQHAWLLEAAQSTWDRLVLMKKALHCGDRTAEGLEKAGFPATACKGLSLAIETYGEEPDSASYLKAVQAALRTLLPDKNVDLGLPEDLSESPDEVDIEPAAAKGATEDMEETVLGLLDELDTDGKGAPREDLEKRAEAEGISSMELEEISNSLMDKGLVYEPNLRYLKKI